MAPCWSFLAGSGKTWRNIKPHSSGLEPDSEMWRRHLISCQTCLFFLTGAILHFPLKRAVTSVLAIGEVYILQSCCGTIPRPRHAHMNTHVEGRSSCSGHPRAIVGTWGNLTSLLQRSLLSDRHQSSFKAKLRKGHGKVANLYPVLWPKIGSVTLPHGSAQPNVFSQQLNGETIDLSTNITYLKEHFCSGF